MKINVRDTGKLKPRHMSPNIEINNDIEGRNASGTDTQNGVVQEGQRMKAEKFRALEMMCLRSFRQCSGLTCAL